MMRREVLSRLGIHPLHQAIGQIITQDGFPRCEILKDPACDTSPQQHVTLFQGAGPDRVRFCQVDILIALPEKATVIIEIEESNVKPVQIFGKFFASAFSTHHDTNPIDQPLLFIQVVDTAALKLGKTKKGGQWSVIKAIIKSQSKKWPGRDVRYELVEGNANEFSSESEKGTHLIQMVKGFLKERR